MEFEEAMRLVEKAINTPQRMTDIEGLKLGVAQAMLAHKYLHLKFRADELADALDMCRAIIKFHVKNAGACVSFAPEEKPFSALDAYGAACTSLAKFRGDPA